MTETERNLLFTRWLSCILCNASPNDGHHHPTTTWRQRRLWESKVVADNSIDDGIDRLDPRLNCLSLFLISVSGQSSALLPAPWSTCKASRNGSLATLCPFATSSVIQIQLLRSLYRNVVKSDDGAYGISSAGRFLASCVASRIRLRCFPVRLMELISLNVTVDFVAFTSLRCFDFFNFVALTSSSRKHRSLFHNCSLIHFDGGKGLGKSSTELGDPRINWEMLTRMGLKRLILCAYWSAYEHGHSLPHIIVPSHIYLDQLKARVRLRNLSHLVAMATF